MALSPLPSQRLPSPFLSISGGGGCGGFWAAGGALVGLQAIFSGWPRGGEVASAERSEARLSRWGSAGQVDLVQQLQAEAVAAPTRCTAARCCVPGLLHFLCHKNFHLIDV